MRKDKKKIKLYNMIRLLMAFALLVFNISSMYGQERDRFVRDKNLDKILRKYLIKHVDFYSEDSRGNYVRDASEYRDVVITTKNLKTDSILENQTITGVYSCKYASIRERPWLYIQYHNKIKFIDLDKKPFRLNKITKKILKFLSKHSDEFTLEEKLITIQNVMETIYFNRHI